MEDLSGNEQNCYVSPVVTIVEVHYLRNLVYKANAPVLRNDFMILDHSKESSKQVVSTLSNEFCMKRINS